MKRKLSIAISLVVILTMALTSLALAAEPPAQVVFTTDLPCPVSVIVISYTDPNGVIVNFVSGSTPWTLDTLPSTLVSFTYPVPVVCNGVTYNSVSILPGNPVTSGAAGSSITVVGRYIPDTTPPIWTFVPDDFSVEATGPTGAIVAYLISASDPDDLVSSQSCSPASFSMFPLGTTTVNCSATDTHGNTSTASFQVTVVDTTSPALTLPSNMTVNTSSNSGLVVNFTASANDIVDGPVPVTCLPASGSLFPIGTTTVNCSASDVHSNTASGRFTVTVIFVDTTSPVWTVPADLTIEATGPAGTIVTYSAAATDPDDAVNSQSCSPASGVTFPLGTTTVSCTATDTHGNTGSASFHVTVIDTTPPVLTLPADMTVNASDPSGAVVDFAASANDQVDGPLSVICLPASGSLFSIGKTTVNCSVTDAHGNSASGSFTVTVKLVDTTPPTITFVSRLPAPNSLGWNNSDVTVTWSCSDNEGVLSSTVTQVVSMEGAALSAIGTCTDTSGNTASDTQTGINIDKTAPTLSPAISPLPVVLNSNPSLYTVSAGARDSLSGIDAEGCAGAVDTSSVGLRSVTCTATDKAGNSNSSMAIYSVQYAPEGIQCKGIAGHQILQPINADGSSVFEQGRTVPAKFRVCGVDGDPIGTPGVVTNFRLIQIISQGVVTIVDQAVESTPPHDVFRSGNGQWIFDISTKDLLADTIYVYLITLNDGSTIQFQFTLK